VISEPKIAFNNVCIIHYSYIEFYNLLFVFKISIEKE